MDHFERRGGVLHAEDVPIPRIAEAVGTPFYVYASATLRRHAQVFRAGVGEDALVAFSVKALSNVAVLKVLASEGLGADIVSGGELARARSAGIPGERIVFSGVGKTRAEMTAALEARIYQFNVESEAELRTLSEVASARGSVAPVALRVNPDVDAGTLDKISTGRKDDKFGVPWERAPALYDLARRLPGIEARGVDLHIGSQIASLAPFEAAARRAGDLIEHLRAEGHDIDRLDLGGGLGIPYGDGVTPPDPAAYAAALRRVTDALDVRLVFEPGRMIAGNAGLMIAGVIYTKAQEARSFAILDAGMNDLIRPALYGARHAIVPVAERDGDPSPFDVVGPVCETTDLFARDVPLTAPAPGDILAFKTAGAYGAVQASQYNTRPLIPEVLVDGDRFAVVRRRPSTEDMLALEELPDWTDRPAD
ncbi:diaminopimelate decarboxylase [Parvularcula dongshanensis]|uniref:Diaminopimelate decarboxylase n=1 Tax=Parvularcula dongshanensis TaxID=1173995 RepID=A0A840I0F2_9PROT|nr:diaminopimelate decarboxylase [Parvularcula dongshanensis]